MNVSVTRPTLLRIAALYQQKLTYEFAQKRYEILLAALFTSGARSDGIFRVDGNRLSLTGNTLYEAKTQSKAARLIGLTDRSMRRYIAGDTTPIPRVVEYALAYVIQNRLEEK